MGDPKDDHGISWKKMLLAVILRLLVLVCIIVAVSLVFNVSLFAQQNATAGPVVHKIDFGTFPLPKELTVKVDEKIEFFYKRPAPGDRMFVDWKVIANNIDPNPLLTLEGRPIWGLPKVLVARRSGTGKLIIFYRGGHPQAPVHSTLIKVTVQPK